MSDMGRLHVAAPYDAQAMSQRCERCGAILLEPHVYDAEYPVWNEAKQEGGVIVVRRTAAPLRRPFQPGSIVGLSRYALWLDLTPGAEPTCEAMAQQGAA